MESISAAVEEIQDTGRVLVSSGNYVENIEIPAGLHVVIENADGGKSVRLESGDPNLPALYVGLIDGNHAIANILGSLGSSTEASSPDRPQRSGCSTMAPVVATNGPGRSAERMRTAALALLRVVQRRGAAVGWPQSGRAR